MSATVLILGCLAVAAAALLPLRRALFFAALALVVFGYAARRIVGDGSFGVSSSLAVALVFLAVVLIRHLAEQRRQARLLLTAERAAAQARAQAAAAAERTRIARDLHDGLTHQLSGLLLQVQAAQALLADGDIEQAVTTMAASAASARRCLTEARDVVGVLRTGSPDLGALRDVAHQWAQATGRSASVLLPACQWLWTARGGAR